MLTLGLFLFGLIDNPKQCVGPHASTGKQSNDKQVALGAFIPRSDVDPGEIDRYASMVEDDPAIVMWFQDWQRNSAFKTDALDAVHSRGAMPMVTWMPHDYTKGPSQPEYSLSEISSGKYDTYIRLWAEKADEWGKPMYLRFAQEMNIPSFSWSAGINGNTASEYVRAWRHVHDIFAQEGASNVRWVWSPNHNGDVAYSQLYPGNDYVDWVGIDGYNWGTNRPVGWQTFEEVFTPSYEKLTRLTDNKPMMLAEFASAASGGEKDSWIRRGLLETLPQKFPRIEVAVWFDQDKEADWRVNSSQGSLAAYKDVADSPLYDGRLCN